MIPLQPCATGSEGASCQSPRAKSFSHRSRAPRASAMREQLRVYRLSALPDCEIRIRGVGALVSEQFQSSL